MSTTATPNPNEFHRLAEEFLSAVLDSLPSSPAPFAVLQQREGFNTLMSLIDSSVPYSREHSTLLAVMDAATGIARESNAKIAKLQAQVDEQSQTIDLLQKQVELLDLQQKLASMRIDQAEAAFAPSDRHHPTTGEPSQTGEARS